METGNGNSSEDGAFAVSRKWKNKRKQASTTLNKDDASTSNLPKTSNANVKTVNFKCYRCKQIGHYRTQCPNNSNLNTKNEDRKQTNAFSAVFLSGSFNKRDRYIDSGANVHLTANTDWIASRYRKVKEEIIVANQETVSVTCAGDVKIITTVNGSKININIEDVFCVPELTTNLISVSKLIEKGNRVYFYKDGCLIHNRDGDLVATAALLNGVYRLNIQRG
ncbi:hypothetical protein EVAR_8301_1 [Eumeta japonica]|uniref:CCHC-type domain-containing protein n=1 Tax=Eumeta variegata TaxID=151549 RepID=A0A4C1YB57_EUMVA|nr:hypothetical protein EVAR_8301_1 [Eumeta japonica]